MSEDGGTVAVYAAMRTADTHWRPFHSRCFPTYHDRHRRRTVDSRRPVNILESFVEHEEHDASGQCPHLIIIGRGLLFLIF